MGAVASGAAGATPVPSKPPMGMTPVPSGADASRRICLIAFLKVMSINMALARVNPKRLWYDVYVKR